MNLYLSIIIVLSLSALQFNEATVCSTITPNCLTCNTTDCTLCADNFYYSTFRDYSNKTKKLCANQICQPNYGIVESSTYTLCKPCTISNCTQCHWTSDAVPVQTCLLCAASTYLSSDSLTCKNKSANISFTYYVHEAPYLAADINASSQLTRNGSYAFPFFFLQQALVASELDSKSYINVTTTIYLMAGSHFFFQCDSSYYDPNAEKNSFDDTTALFSYCGNSSFTNISSYYFKNDNNKIYVKALTCEIAANLSLTSYSTLCVDLSTKYSGSKPTLFINSPRYYFNITSFAYFENIKFSGVNAFASLSTNPYAYFRYFPVQLCSMSSTIDDRYGQMKFSTTKSESDIGFTYTCSDPFYAGSTIPTSRNIDSKCTTSSSYRQSLGRCSGEVYNKTYFNEYSYDYAVDTGSVYYEDRRKVLFNIYAFSDFFSVNKSAPTLILNKCDFEYFLYDYEALIYVETYNIYKNTQPSYTNTTKNPYTFYTYTGNDRGANINITSSTFKYSRFCKGAIVYRKPQHQTDFAYIFNFTHQFSKNWNYSDSGSQILIVDSDFNYMNYMTNLTAISYYIEPALSKPTLPMYSGVDSQATISYGVFFHMGIIINVNGFGGPIEISGCNMNNNAFFIPEILPYSQSNKEHYSLDYFKNSTTTELSFAACNYETTFNQYFFSNGIDINVDIDYLTTVLERYSTIQIQKNKGVVIIKDSTFKENIGIFGGVISIYSPNFETGIIPYVVIENCDFLNNMAYITGGAAFINPAIRQSELAQICAGISISDSYFYQNMGLVKSSGGAVSIICGHISNYITSFTGSSKINKTNMTNSTILYDTQTIVELFHGNLTNFTDKVETTFYHKLYKEAVLIQDTIFEENYVGLKGSAVYVKYVSQVVVNNSEFSSNGPMYLDNELMISPYYVMFSPNSIIFQDENGACFDEFDFFANCSTPETQIPLPQLEGALHINFCSEYVCVNVNNTQNSLIMGNIFRFNDAGPYLSPKQDANLATALYINGGFNNTLLNNQFYAHYGNFEFQIHRRLQSFYWFMPESYFNKSHAPVVRIITAPMNLLAKVSYITNFYGNRFWNNKNNQITGMSNAFQYYGSLIYYTSTVQSTSVVQTYFNMTLNTFSNNMFIGEDSSLIYIYNALVNLTSNTFSGNGYISRNITENYPSNLQKFNYKFNNYSFQYASHHGIFWVDADYKFNSYHYIYNNTFNYSSAREGSVFYFTLTNQTVLLKYNSYSYLFALESGSYMSATSSVTTNTIQMVNETISYSYCGTNGALYSYNDDSNIMNLIINQTTFSNCYAGYGSAISVFQTGKLLCYQDKFVRNVYANETAFVYSQLQQNISLVNGFIDNDTLYFLTHIYQGAGQIYMRSSNNTGQQLLFRTSLIQALSYTYLGYNEFIDCYFFQLINQFGAVIYAKSSNVRLYQSNSTSPAQGIYSSTSDFGAVFISDLSILSAENIIFQNNTSVYDGSVLYFKQAYANITNCNFSSNNGSGQGTVYLYFKSQINITSCTFTNNYAYDSSAIFANKNHNINQRIMNTTFTNNTSILNMFNMDYSNLTFDSCLFLDNIAIYVTHGFSLSNSGLTITNSIVNYTLSKFLNSNDYQVLAGFFNLIYGSNLNLASGVQILGCRGSEAGAIYALTNSIISITNGVLFQDCESNIGPCIYIKETQSVTIDSSQFIGNSQIDIQLLSSNIFISNSIFDKGSDQYLHATDSSVTLKGVTMQNIYNIYALGAGIYCSCQLIDIENCTFNNLQGVEGGALYLDLSASGLLSTIVQSNFLHNSAQVGGAIYILQIDQLSIIASNFTKNRGYYDSSLNTTLTLNQGMGGAIFYMCSDTSLACQMTLQDSNNFTNNYASHQGGAIIWLTTKYLESGMPSIFNSNTATYGADVASFPKELKMTMVSTTAVSSRRMLSTSNLIDISNSTDGESDNSTSSNWTIVSGNGFYFVISIIDQDGLDYRIDNQSVANIVSIDKTKNITLDNAQAVAKMGIFSFKNIEVTVVPGTAISLYVQISGLESYASNIAFVDDPQEIDFYVRFCEPGEAYTTNYQCITCPVNYYLFDVNNSFSTCKTCDDNAKCYYGAVVTPLKGYWRSSIYSENFMKCPNPKVCVGGDQNVPLGKCETGYSGILCGECDDGYSLVNDFQCSQCPSTGANIVRLIVFYIFGVVLTMILVYCTISNIEGNLSYFQVYIKILINHFQEIGIITAINSSWSSIIQSLVVNQQGVGSILQQFFSVDCLIKSANLNYKVFYQKMILKVFIPIVFIGFGWIGGLIYTKVKSPDLRQRDLNVCIAVIILFLIYPDLCTTIFESFNCVAVDSNLRLVQDLSIICYQTKGSSHLYVIIFVSLPALIIWVIGIPAFLTLQFVKQKQIFKEMEKVKKEDDINTVNTNIFLKRACRIRYSFISNGFTNEEYYWYELVILYRKLIMIIVITYLQTASTDIQTLLCLLVLVFSLFAQLIRHPYKCNEFNRLEMMSLIVCSITLYAGLFFIQNQLYGIYNDTVLGASFFVIIIVPNLCLFIYFIYLIRIQVLIYVFPMNKILFTVISCWMIKRKDFQEMYFPDPDIARKEKKEEKAKSQKQASGNANGAKLLKSQIGAAKDYEKDDKNDVHEEDDESHVEEKKEDTEEVDMDKVLNNLFQKPMQQNNNKMFEGITDHKQIEIKFSDINKSYNVTIEDEIDKYQQSSKRKLNEQDEDPNQRSDERNQEERKSGSNEQDRDDQVETDHERIGLVDSNQPRRTINNLNQSFNNPQSKQQLTEEQNKYGMTFGSGSKQKRQQQLEAQQREIKYKEAEDKSMLKGDDPKDLKLKSNSKPSKKFERFI